MAHGVSSTFTAIYVPVTNKPRPPFAAPVCFVNFLPLFCVARPKTLPQPIANPLFAVETGRAIYILKLFNYYTHYKLLRPSINS
jgi:hypothetical protein